MKIAILEHSTRNIGDDIQSLALEQLLPQVDLRVDRDQMGPAAAWGEEVAWILNGWFAPHTHSVWPPPGNARKLFLGFHAVHEDILPRILLDRPIGCRDPWTLSLCNRAGIDVWLSWCITLTLRRPDVKRNDTVVLADVPERDVARLPAEITKGIRVTNLIPPDTDRRGRALELLELYAGARWVITSRLHAMLPCVAFGTPVVFIPPARSENRTFGYLHLPWRIDNAPWDDPQPRVTDEDVGHLAQPIRNEIRRFITP